MDRTIIADEWKLRQLPPSAPDERLDPETLTEASAREGDDWLDAGTMPKMVHDVLREEGVIDEPWRPGEAERCRWVAEKDWVYATDFAVDDPGGRAFLSFEGLDTIADVYLNCEHVSSHADMYAPHRVDVTGRLEPENTLVIHFHTVFDLGGAEPEPIHSFNEDDTLVRRPGNNYSDYLGPDPYFSRVGIFDEVAVETVGFGEISDVIVGTSLDAELAHGEVDVALEGKVEESGRVEVEVLGPEGKAVATAAEPIAEGEFEASLEVEVENPELWWPRGYGDQPLYEVATSLVVDGATVHEAERKIGFRHVSMPERLHFQINGVRVRLWGAGWVTPDWTTAVWDGERAAKLLDMAEHANFNALRVWEGSNPPAEEFYEMADERGILLWQDFFDLPLEPDEDSIEFCRREAARQIGERKHHPSVLLWNGGNEEALFNEAAWGGEGGRWPGRDASEAVGEVCAELDPDRHYHPTSPDFGIDANDPQDGDTHGYSNIWYIPGDNYLNFASEDCRIGPPMPKSLERFIDSEDLLPEGYTTLRENGDEYPFPESWLPYTTATSWKKVGPVEKFNDATDLDTLVYRLGMAEAMDYEQTIERQRRGRPPESDRDRQCGGYLAWKFNDSWPQIYSGRVDYFLEPYLSYYALKRAYEPLLLSYEIGDHIWLWAVNDTTDPVDATVTAGLHRLKKDADLEGEETYAWGEGADEIQREVTVAPDESVVVARLDEAGIGTFRRENILYARMEDDDGKLLARTNAFAENERRLTFPEAQLNLTIREGDLVVTTDRFARCVVLEGNADGDAFGWLFENNYFDLLPGEEKVVGISGEHREGHITASPWYSPHTASVDWSVESDER